MDNFRYYTPTEVIFGKEVEKDLKALSLDATMQDTLKLSRIRPLEAADVNRIYQNAMN